MKKVYNHPLIDEIKYHPDWLAWKQINPVGAIAFLDGIIKDLPWQWSNFLKYRELRKVTGHCEMPIMDGVEAAVMPEVYQRWMKKLQPCDYPSKYWIDEFLINHKELWDPNYNWTKKQAIQNQNNRYK